VKVVEVGEDRVAMNAVGTTLGNRLMGEQASRFKAILVSAIVGGTAAVATYRLLRNSPGGED
jgi:hypothetical protein